MAVDNPATALEIGFWFSLLTLVAESAIKSYSRYKKGHTELFLALVVFFGTHTVGHALGIVHKFFCMGDHCMVIERISGIIDLMGEIYLFYVITNKTFSNKKFVYAFLVAPIGLLILDIMFIDLRTLPIYIILPLAVVYGFTLPTIYFYIALKTGGAIRIKSLVLDAGWVLYFCGVAVQRTNVEPTAPWVITMWESITGIPFGIIGPLLMILAIPCFYYGYFEES